MKINKKTVTKKSVKKEIKKIGKQLKNIKGTVTIGKYTLTKN